MTHRRYDRRVEKVILEVGRYSQRLTRSQLQSLELLAKLSTSLTLVKTAESTCEYAPAWLEVALDIEEAVIIGDDGGLELVKAT